MKKEVGGGICLKTHHAENLTTENLISEGNLITLQSQKH